MPTPNLPAIGTISDPTKVRVALMQGDRLVSAPMMALFTQPQTAFFYAEDGARVVRIADRLFIGPAIENSGKQVADAGDWLTTFQLGVGRSRGFIQRTQAAVLNSDDPEANHAWLSAAQSKDATTDGNNAIASIAIAINNNTTKTVSAFGRYVEAYRMSGAIGGAYGHEIDTVNYASSVTINPFAQDTGQTVGLQLAAGADLAETGQFPSSAAINIRNNNSTYKTGIVFGNDALDGTDGATGEGEAIAFAPLQCQNYYYASGSVSWQVYASPGVDGDYNITTNGAGAVSVPRLTLTDGKVKFPATQAASSDANTLDDYEEGTFTPTITFGGASTGVTYSKQVGKYTKIGNAVTVAIHIILTSKGTSTGAMVINNLPFTVTSDLDVAAPVRCANLATSAITDLQGVFGSGTKIVNITRYSAGSAAQLTDADLSNTSNIRIAGSYFVD